MKSPKLMRDITLCLIVKAILLMLLWWVCFSHPVSEKNAQQHLADSFQSSTNG